MSSQDHDLPAVAAAEADATCDPRPRWSALVKWMLTLIGIAQVVTLSVVAIQAVSLIDHDGIAYIRIATYYFHRQWHLAVSGYWGPLFSWLMLPLIAGVGDPQGSPAQLFGRPGSHFGYGAYASAGELVSVSTPAP